MKARLLMPLLYAALPVLLFVFVFTALLSCSEGSELFSGGWPGWRLADPTGTIFLAPIPCNSFRGFAVLNPGHPPFYNFIKNMSSNTSIIIGRLTSGCKETFGMKLTQGIRTLIPPTNMNPNMPVNFISQSG